MLNTSFRPNETFAVKAVGNSMNQALVNGESINDGDYVIVDNKQRSIEEYNNKYVLSVISGMSNIKRLVIDRLNDRIQLLSESSDSYPPIYIHEEDFGEYMVNGLVTDVVKSPKLYSGSNS
jgi:SOS-response transcriptional repressor LexA